jgi:TonB-linked SusC/RagA family outer membrane protein
MKINHLLFALTLAAALIGGETYAISSESVYGHDSESIAQQRALSGTIVDNAGVPVIGASVFVKGTTTGTVTSNDGTFSLNVAEGTQLTISCIGYKTITVSAKSGMRVILEDDTEALEEIVVVGYGTQKKADLTGAVATVDVGKTLESKSTADLGKALQGAVPGLTVINSNGKIGNEPSIVIRGIGTLSNSETSTPLYIVDGVPIDDISYLNTQDIENISVLKDAASSSIYGTRAAFGVVLITTKGANTKEKVKVSYTNNFGWSQATVLPSYPSVMEQITGLNEVNARMGVASELFGMYMDSDEFIAGVKNWEAKHGGKTGYREMVEGDDYISGVGYFANWDVGGIMFNDAAPSQNHNLAVQGTVGKTNYYISLGYDKEQGLMEFNPDKLDKYNTTVNVTSQVMDWLQVGARINFMYKNYRDPTDALRQGTYQYMWRWGSFFGPWGTINGMDCRNAISYRKQAGDNYSKTDNLRLGGFLKATIIKGLTVNADFTYLNTNWRYEQVNLPVTLMNTWSTTPSETTLSTTTYISDRRSWNRGYNTNIYGNYEFTVAENHNFNIMLGFNADKSDYEYLRNDYYGILDENLVDISLTNDADGKNIYRHSHSAVGSAGFFGRLNYNYKDRILVELNGRYDGSSKFPENDRWAFFPSASAGWRISEEPFFSPIKGIVNNAKIRASYGEIGNQEVGSNMYIQTIARSGNSVNWLGDGNAKYDTFGMPKMVSSSLTWETLKTTNLGIDLGFLNGELNASFDWFQRKTVDMLAPGQTMPAVLGTSAAYENAGTLRSRGWEITIDWHHSFNGLNVYAIGNLSDYKTKITKWNNTSRLLNSYYSGKTYGDIWGFETDRYFEASDFNSDGTYATGVADQDDLESGAFNYGPGDIKFKDLNGDGVIDGGLGTAEDHGDLKVIGNTQPRYQYSLRIGGDWKGFDLDLYFQGVGKRHVWTQSAFVMPLMRGADAIYSNQTSYITNEDAEAGIIDQDATYPRLYAGGAGKGTISVLSNGRYNFYPQSKYLVNLAYLRLKTVTIGYTIPSFITQKVKIEKVRFYGSINNALDIIQHTRKYGIDPEINTGEGSYANGVWGRTDPFMRTYSVGVQITF